MPDIESTFFQPRRDDGLYAIALDPDDSDALDVGGLSEYVDWLDVSYPVGIETIPTYDVIEGVHDGANPFPVDIIIDSNGIIQYIAREYDPYAMDEVLTDLLGP